MDIHPLVVHIPIAFLVIYSLAEICTIGTMLKNSRTWFWIKSFLLAVGFIGAQSALATGEAARHIAGTSINRTIVYMHEQFASSATGLFGALIIVYAILIIYREVKIQEFLTESAKKVHEKLPKLVSYIMSIGAFLQGKRWFIVIVAIAGLIAISITGALGGALVYGPSADPFVSVVIKMLGL